MPKEDFSAWRRRRPYTQNGTQTCNYCFQLLAVFRCAQRTRERLRTLRRKLQRQKKEQILDQVRADIWAIVGSRLSSSCQASVPQESSHQVPQKIGEQRLAEHKGGQTKEAEPKATQRSQDDGREMSMADVEDRKRDVDNAETQQAEREAKQRKDEAHEARERQTELQGQGVLRLRQRIQQERDQAIIEEVWREIAIKTNSTLQSKPCVTELPGKTFNPAGVGNSREAAASAARGADAGKESHAHRGPDRNKDSTFHYICPFCDVAISSSVRSGMVDHRNQCGHQFRVQDGRVTAKKLAYRCPFCGGNVASNVMTGRIDHRSVCGNRFYVKSGKVSEGTRQHAHTCPQCQSVVWSACASGRIRVQHKTPSGRQCPRSSWNSEEKKPA